MRKLFTALTLTLLTLSPALAMAQVSGVQQLPDSLPQGEDSVLALINTVINWFFTLLIVLAVAFIVYAAYKYLFSGGSEEGVSTAHKMLMYAAVAIAVGTLAKGIVFTVQRFVLGGSGGTTSTSATSTPATSALGPTPGICANPGVGFFKVPHPTLTDVFVDYCSNDKDSSGSYVTKYPAVIMDGQTFGSLSNITLSDGKQSVLVPYSIPGHTAEVQQCSNGRRPVMCVSGGEIRPLDGRNIN